MTTHLLACALFCNSDGTLNGAGTFLADTVLGLLGFGVVVWVIRKAVEAGKQMTGRRR